MCESIRQFRPVVKAFERKTPLLPRWVGEKLAEQSHLSVVINIGATTFAPIDRTIFGIEGFGAFQSRLNNHRDIFDFFQQEASNNSPDALYAYGKDYVVPHICLDNNAYHHFFHWFYDNL